MNYIRIAFVLHLSAFRVRSCSLTRVRFALISSYCFLAVAVVVIVTVKLVVIVIAVANVVST